MADKVPTLLTEDLINLYESAGFNPCDVFDPKTVGMIKKLVIQNLVLKHILKNN